jgi:hypothetical protein
MNIKDMRTQPITYKIVPNFIPYFFIKTYNIFINKLYHLKTLYRQKDLNKYNELYKKLKKQGDL